MRRDRGMPSFTAGLIALGVVLVATYLTFFGFPHPGGYRIHAVFPATGGDLRPGTPVRIAGVNVGRVTKVGHGPGGTAVATLRIGDSGRPIHTDATAKIRPRLFLENNVFVDLRPGSPSAPELHAGGTIPLSQTAIAVQLDQVLDVLDTDTRHQLQTGLQGLATALNGGGARALHRGLRTWPGAFRAIAAAVEDVRGRDAHDLSATIAGQAHVARALADHDRELSDLVGQFQRTVHVFATHGRALADTLTGAAHTLGTARPALADLDPALPALERTARELRPVLAAAPSTLDPAIPFLRRARSLLAPEALPRFTRLSRPLVADLVPLEPRLVELLRLVRPVVDCVQRNALPVLQAKVDDGPLSTDQPVWQELLHFTVGLAGAGQDFDGNGFSVRYLAGAGPDLVGTFAPGAGPIVGLADRPLLGARPAYQPGKTPPYRPDVPCATQKPPDLKAETTPAPPARRAARALPRPTRTDYTRALRALRARARGRR